MNISYNIIAIYIIDLIIVNFIFILPCMSWYPGALMYHINSGKFSWGSNFMDG